MIQMLGGDEETVHAFSSSVGKKISKIELGHDDVLRLTFEEGSLLKILDKGQSCCESRYMRTDDNLADYVGGNLLGAEIRDAPNQTDEYREDHEIQFLVIKTSNGQFTMSSHNEHNGYYGGFSISAELEERAN